MCERELLSIVLHVSIEEMGEDGGVEAITHGTCQVHVEDIEQEESHEELLQTRYRFVQSLSRREDDFCIECSTDGKNFTQMRVCHMHKATGKVQFGIYACSPEESSFKAIFTDMKLTDCAWKAHDGQQADY